MLICGMLFYLAVRTGIDLLIKGARGSACYSPRLQMAFTVMIIFTFLVFWGLCAPFGPAELKVWTYGSLTVHAFTPALAVGNYVLFCEPGHLKKRDIFLCLLIPICYTLLVAALGLGGTVFYVLDGVKYYSPYPFMDFGGHTIFTMCFLVITSVLFCATAAGFYYADVNSRLSKNSYNQ